MDFATGSFSPAKDLFIVQISGEDDGVWVRVLGAVVSMGEGHLVLDDGTGSLKVNVFEAIEEVELMDIVRVMGRVDLDQGGEVVLTAVSLTRLEGVDMELYRKVVELEQSLLSGGKENKGG
ncbi:MAG: OB-fold nucleic acid binding domain-containing protein [Asgard group archaeon]